MAKWDINDVYDSEIYGDSPYRDYLNLEPQIDSGEVVIVTYPIYKELSEEVKNEMKDADKQDRIRYVLASVIEGEDSHKLVITLYRVFDDEKPVLMILEDKNSKGRKPKTKRTKNKVSDIKPT